MFSKLKAWLLGRGASPAPEPEEGVRPLPATQEEGESSPREQHYVFAHQLLPRWFFKEPEAFIDSVTRPAGIAHLQQIWERLGSDVRSRGGVKIPGTGLAARRVEVDGQPAALLHLPRPEAYAEACFVCLVVTEMPEEARFFVLERTRVPEEREGSTEHAALCEWLEGGRRRNHQTVIIPEPERFLAEVERTLQEERKRREAAAPVVNVPTWDVAGGEHPLDAAVAHEPIRFQPCLFAFHLLPHVVFDPKAPLVMAAVEGREAQVVDKLWQRAGMACRSLGHDSLPSEQVPRIGPFTWRGDAYLLIRMPEALSAPEPLLIAIPRRGRVRYFFLLERTEEKGFALLTVISEDGRHAILGVMDDPDESTFMNVLSTLDASSLHEPPNVVIPHRRYYPRIAEAAEHALPDLPVRPRQAGDR